MATEERKEDKLYIKPQRRAKNFFVTSSAKMTGNKPTATTISSSIFTEMSKSFHDGDHLLDEGVRELNSGILYMLQQMEEDIDGVYNEVSASAFQASFFPFATINSASIGVVSSSLIPEYDNKYDLGSSGKEWKNLFIDGTANIDKLAVGTVNDLIPTVPAGKTGGQYIGAQKARWKGIYLASTIDVSGSQLIISSPSASAAGNDFNVIISGSVVAGDTASGSIGTIDAPFKDLYVQSSSIYLADMSDHNGKSWKQMSRSEKLQRSTVFRKNDVDKLKRGESLNDSGIISASGDLFVSGSTKLIGNTEIHGNTTITGLTDIRGGFRINQTPITDAELEALRGMSGDNIQTQLNSKQNNLSFGISSGHVIKAGSGIADDDFLRINGTTLEGRSASEVKSDLSLVKGDVGLGNVDNTTDANKPVSTATQTALNGKYTLGATVPSDLNPDRDARFTLGAANARWSELYVQTSVTDGFQVSKGVHILGGAGAVTVSQIPTNGVLDARAANVFYMGVNGDINGIVGSRVTGQVVTIIQPNLRTNTFIHQSSNANVHPTEKFVLTASRDLRARGPLSIRFIYDGTLRVWYRLI